ncbi:MAG TPA: c-type cytochrome [Burkholderiales bacterium]|jgi:cytochrome c|nr:c-type cytochrome [Burkholderiales bacterium]
MKRSIMVVLASAALGFAAHAGAAVDAAKANQLSKDKNCVSCHTVDKKLVGPAFKEIAAKYKGNKDAQAMLVKKVINGGGGVWGPIPMPPNPVKEDEAKLLVDWILAM